MTELYLTASKTADVHMRVEDYLDDKIQTAADLENVDDLISRVQQQQNLLRKQLADARHNLAESRAKIDKKSGALHESAREFQRQQHDLDRRLQILAQSEVSDDATKKIESRMSKVRTLEVAHGYLELVQRADALNKHAKESLPKEPEASLRAYHDLRAIWDKVQEAQPGAEGAAPQLLYLLEQQTTQLYQDLKTALSNDLRQTLELMKWPSKDLNLLGNVRERWQRQAELLLELQEPDLLKFAADKLKVNATIAPDPVILLPLETMVQPLATRFRYHFYGERPTNRLDKPEYFFSHVLDLIDRHSSFISDLLGPIVDDRAMKSDALELIYTDAVSSFIAALLPMVNAKCLSFLPQITSDPQLLSHFMREVMSFDNVIRGTWAYVPIPRMLSDWRGVTWTILYTHGYFQTWLTVEKDFALARYASLKDFSSDSREIDFDAEPGQTKPTKGAIRVNDLLETITDRYRGLSSFSYKMKFLLEIQLSIFDDYHNYLQDALQAYIAVSHTAGRLLQGQSETDTFGLKGLESLVKIFGSAEYLERKMSDWSDDLFFLELWDELLTRSRADTGNDSIGNNLRVDDVAAKTSTAIKANPSTEDIDTDGSGLFDQTAAVYRRLRERSEEEIVRAFDVNVRSALKLYGKQPQWSSLGDAPSDAAALAPSPALDSLFQTSSVLLGFLSRTISPGALRRLTRHFCTSIQREIYDNVLMHNTFSAAGQLNYEKIYLLLRTVSKKATKTSGAIGSSMKRVEEAIYLLALPSRKPEAATSKENDDWGFEEEEDRSSTIEAHGLSESEDAVEDWGLWDAEKRIFESNEAARNALADMRLYHLTESDARNILKRRVELNS